MGNSGLEIQHIESSKRSAILNTATTLFSEHGFHAVGIDRIIAESGVAKMTMYRHFPAKDNLVLEVLEKRQEGVRTALLARTDTQNSAIGKIKAIFTWHEEWLNTPDFHGCMFMRAASEYGTKENKIRHVADAQKKDLIEIITKILRDDEVKISRARRLGSALVMLLDGAIVSAEVSGNRSAASEAWIIAKTLLNIEME